MQDFRITMGPVAAGRATREFPVPRPSNAAARLGLRYENKVGEELKRHVASRTFKQIEHNPWFTFTDTYGTNHCCPDFLLFCDNGVVIVEVKLSWVDIALPKLTDLYMPVVSAALGMPALPLVVCRNITPAAPEAKLTLGAALMSPGKLLHWPNTGHIQW